MILEIEHLTKTSQIQERENIWYFNLEENVSVNIVVWFLKIMLV